MSEPVSCPVSTADARATSDRKEGVQFRLQLVVVNASGHERVQEVARIERDEVAMETLGLTLAEGKLILKSIQRAWSRGRPRTLSFGGAIARNAARHVTARGITTSRFARCLGISSCRARGWSTAGARCISLPGEGARGDARFLGGMLLPGKGDVPPQPACRCRAA